MYCIYTREYSRCLKNKYRMNVYVFCTNVQIKKVLSTYSKRWHVWHLHAYTQPESVSHIWKFIFAGTVSTPLPTHYSPVILLPAKIVLFLSLRGSFWALDVWHRWQVLTRFYIHTTPQWQKCLLETRQQLESIVEGHLVKSQVTYIYLNSSR